MIHELDLVRTVDAVAEIGIPAGYLGTVVGVYANNAAFEVEFLNSTGHTIGVITVAANQVQAVSERASVEKFRAALATVPDIDPPDFDRLER